MTKIFIDHYNQWLAG